MPSAKPDKEEINALRLMRGIRYEERSAHLYIELHNQCELAVDEGYTSPERAAILLEFLQKNPLVAAIYPNNVLYKLVQEGCNKDGWCPEIEHDLLRFIYSIYLGYEKPNYLNTTMVISSQGEEGELTLSTLAAEPNEPRPPTDLSFIMANLSLSAKQRTALLYDYLDAITKKPNLQDRFVGFTGKFEFGSRADCFAEARKLGAVPCDPAPYMDYLFISRELEEYGTISSKLDSAIYFRRVYGYPQILREQDWNSIVNEAM